MQVRIPLGDCYPRNKVSINRKIFNTFFSSLKGEIPLYFGLILKGKIVQMPCRQRHLESMKTGRSGEK